MKECERCDDEKTNRPLRYLDSKESNRKVC